jgi:hypothetical protein
MTLETSFNWDIITMSIAPARDGFHDVVCSVLWNVEAVCVHNDNKYSESYSEGLDLPPPTDEFIPFDSLTKVQVIQWVKERLGEIAVNNIEQGLTQRLENRINPPYVTKLPASWSSAQ